MEHYHKTSSQYISDAKLINELEISSAGKPYDLATRSLHIIKDNPEAGVVISSRGNYVSKAVTIAELIKRRDPDVIQDTQIKYVRINDVWEPDDEELDTLTVVRRIPAIVIKFTKEQISGAVAAGDEKSDTRKSLETTKTKDGSASKGGMRGRPRGKRREKKEMDTEEKHEESKDQS